MSCYAFARPVLLNPATRSRLIQTPTGQSFKRLIVQIPMAQLDTFVLIGRNLFKGDTTADLARAASLALAAAAPNTTTLNDAIVIGWSLTTPAAPMNPASVFQELHFERDAANQIFCACAVGGLDQVNICGEVYR